jgi:arylsulfatase A-like enzyme/predicted negative regulator of RcsB-dependent stress response
MAAGLCGLSACSGPRGDAPAVVSPSPAGKPSIVLVSIDTTRADHLGCYGAREAATPNIDRWAAEGVVFERARSSVPVTLPAHASLLTGRWPFRHGVRDNGVYRLPDDVPALAALLAADGYATAAAVGAAVLDRQYGLARGFSRYDDGMSSRRDDLSIAERPAGAVTDAALAAARALRPPFFLFVHYYDPHAAYAPPAPFDERFRARPYDGEIAYVDEQLGRLRRELEALGLLRDAVVVVTSDHGEGLGEHGEATHGVFLYDSTLHVPLIVAAPGRLIAGRRVTSPVALVDVMPTLLELAGAVAPPGLDGRSLVAAAGGAALDARPMPLESEFGFNSYGWAPLAGLTDGALKWIDAPEAELYDLGQDAREERNVIEARRADARRLAQEWRKTVTEDRRNRPAPGSDREAAERQARLAALGYVAGTTDAGAPRGKDLPDPKRAIGTLASINDARRLIGERRFDEAARLLDRVLQQSPRNLSALILLGSARLFAGQPARAVAPLQRATLLAPASADAHYNLGLAWLGVGDGAQAERAFRRTLELAPRQAEAAANLTGLLLQLGRPRDAEQALREARAQGAAHPLLDYLEGKLALERGDREAARAALERALAGGLPPPVATEAQALLARTAR